MWRIGKMSQLKTHRTFDDLIEELEFQKTAIRVLQEGINKSLDYFAYNQTLYARESLVIALQELEKTFEKYHELINQRNRNERPE
jgi:hypothetical protein